MTNKQKQVANRIEKELNEKDPIHKSKFTLAEKEENEEMMHSSVQRENQENLNEFKMNLMSKLGGTP